MSNDSYWFIFLYMDLIFSFHNLSIIFMGYCFFKAADRYIYQIYLDQTLSIHSFFYTFCSSVCLNAIASIYTKLPFGSAWTA